jgi:tetratricopeptide (TPR) repeat protein
MFCEWAKPSIDAITSSFMSSQSTDDHKTVVQFKADILGRMSALLCLSVSLASQFPVAAHSEDAAPSILAQAARTSSALNCQTERQQTEGALLNAIFGQAEQAIANGQVDRASQLLVRVLQRIQAMPNSSAKIDWLERLIGSMGANVAYTSPLERLVQAVPMHRPQAPEAVLNLAIEVTRTVSTSYSASKTRTFIAIANYFSQLGQTHRSMSILGEAVAASNTIQGAELKTIALSNIAEAYVRAGQPDVAASILTQLLQLAQAISHSNPYRQAGAFARIVGLYIQIADLESALSIARLIQEPNSRFIAMLAIANKYGETGQFDRALDVLQTVRQSDQKATALAAIAGRLTAQQPQRANQLYAEAVAMARSMQSANEVMAYAAMRYVEAGGLVATADETIRVIADPAVQAPVLGAIALSYAKAGQDDRAETRLKQAIKVLGSISEESNRNTARQKLIDQATQSGRYDYALRITQTIQPQAEVPIDRVEVQTQIAERAIAANRYDAALQITEQIPTSFASWRERLLSPILRELVRTDALDRALEIAQQEDPDPSFQPRMLAVIAAQANLSGQTERSATLFNQAIQLANQIDDANTKSGTLGAIAQAYLTAGQPKQATELFNQTITVTQVIKDISSRSYILRTLAEQLTFANRYQAAIQVAEAIPDSSERLAKLNEVMEKAINAGDFTTILTVLNRLDNPASKTRWFLALVDRYIQLGESTQATNVLNQALQVARTIPGNESRTITIRGGENSLVVEDEEDRGSFLMAIALRYAQISQVSQAQQIAQTVQNLTIRQQLIQQINCYR